MFYLLDFEKVKSKLDEVIQLDIERILREMKRENMDLEGWALIEIPDTRVYSFFNQSTNEAFDYELNEKEKLVPHYYKHKKNTTVTKFAVDSITEAVRRFSLR